MKKYISLLLTLAIAVAVSTLQAAESAEQILDKYVNAIGGVEAHKRLKTRQVQATFTLAVIGAPGKTTITSKAPNKNHVRINIPNLGEVIEAYDGVVAWSSNPFLGVSEKTGSQLKDAQRQADFHQDVNIKSRYSKWTYAGKETVDGKPTHVLKGESKEGDLDTYYIDAESYLLIRAKITAAGPAGPMTLTMHMSDYREVDGIKIPFSLKATEPAAAAYSMVIKEVKHGIEVDDTLFKKP